MAEANQVASPKLANATGPLVGLIMGSDSDWPTMEPAAEVLAEFGIPFEVGVVSAHRTPEPVSYTHLTLPTTERV